MTGGSLLLTQLGQKVEWLTVDLPVSGPLRDVLEVIDAEPLGYARDTVSIPPSRRPYRNTAAFPIAVARRTEAGAGRIRGRCKSRRGRRCRRRADHDISDGDFALTIDKPGARLRGAARFADIPAAARLRAAVSRGRWPQGALPRRCVARRRGAAAARLRDRAGAVQRPGRLDASYPEFTGNRDRELGTGSGRGRHRARSARAPRCRLPEAGWKKAPGTPVRPELSSTSNNDRLSRIRRIDAEAPGLQALLSGRFAENGNGVEQIDIHRMTLGGSSFAGTVARRAAGGWRADIHASGY